jgi:DNA-binding transcriptional LysR family regulator
LRRQILAKALIPDEKARTPRFEEERRMRRAVDTHRTAELAGSADGRLEAAAPSEQRRMADLRSVDLNLLVVLDALLTERSVTRAGKRVYLSQSATSNALNRLRRLFDDPLLVRSGRHLELTTLAESLIQPVREALRSIERVLAVDRGGFDPSSDERTFTLLASDYVTTTVLYPVLQHLWVVAPRMRIDVRPITNDLLELLGRDLIDLVILPTHPVAMDEIGRFPHATVSNDPWTGALSPDNHQVGDSITMRQFETLPYVSHSPWPGRPSVVETELERQRVRRNHRAHLSVPFMTLPFLLAGTEAMAFLPKRLGERVQAMDLVRLVESPVDLPPLEEAMFWNPRHDDDPGHAWLRQTILDLSGGLTTSLAVAS